MARRRGYRRSRRQSEPVSIFTLIAILILIGVSISVYNWAMENKGLLFILIILGLVVWFVLRPKYQQYMDERRLSRAKDVVSELDYYLDKFLVDIPKGSRHSESLYQTDLGRYLKEKLTNRRVEYEIERNGKRPDIVIDGTTAIEVKSMKNPDSDRNRKYNSQHVESIYKKLILYKKEFSKVIFIIFNSDLVRDRNWHAYQEMKDTVKEQGVTLIEK